VGDDCDAHKGLLKLTYPMNHGIVENWEDMEVVWKSIYTKLKIANPQEHNVLITEPALNPYQNREKIAEVFFESFGVPGIYFENQAVLSLYAQGKTTGIVMDVGDGVTQVVPVVEGFTVRGGAAIQRQDLGGRDITQYLMQLLRRQGYHSLHTSAEFQIVKQIKEKFCNKISEKALEDDMEIYNTKEASDYILPDGTKMRISQGIMQEAPEILFEPSKIGLEYEGLPELMKSSIMGCDIDLRSKLCQNTIIAGGCSAMTGFAQRLYFTLLNKHSLKIKLIAPKNRLISCWVGGSTLSCLQSFNQYVTKEEFKEGKTKVLFEKGLN